MDIFGDVAFMFIVVYWRLELAAPVLIILVLARRFGVTWTKGGLTYLIALTLSLSPLISHLAVLAYVGVIWLLQPESFDRHEPMLYVDLYSFHIALAALAVAGVAFRRWTGEAPFSFVFLGGVIFAHLTSMSHSAWLILSL